MDKKIFPETWCKSTLNDILRNPSPPKNPKEEFFFFNPDFVNTLWHCYYRIQNIGGCGFEKWETNFLRWVLHIPVGWLNTMTLESLGSFTLQLSEWRIKVPGSVPVSLPVANTWLRGGSEGELTLNNCHARVWRNRKVNSNLKRKQKALGWIEWR